MLQYIYKSSEIGLSEWPSGEMRLEGVKVTTDPNLADVFVCPGALHSFKNPTDLDKFPYMKGNEERHAFFHCSDDEVLYSKPCLFLRCNTRPWYFDKDPRTISWPWPVGDFNHCVEIPEGGFRSDVSFHGWISTETRKKSAESCRDSGLRADIAMYSQFTGYIGTPGRPEYDPVKFAKMQTTFGNSMRESRVCLCPESIPGVTPYRLWESFSAGRVPLLVGSDFVLPFADQIPYEQFCLFLPRDHAENAGSLISEFIQNTSDEQIIEMGKLGRQYFDRYLHRDKWPALMAEAVQRKLAA